MSEKHTKTLAELDSLLGLSTPPKRVSEGTRIPVELIHMQYTLKCQSCGREWPGWNELVLREKLLRKPWSPLRPISPEEARLYPDLPRAHEPRTYKTYCSDCVHRALAPTHRTPHQARGGVK